MRLLALATLFAGFTSAATAGELKIHAINVGWGQSVLVEGPNGTTLLIDAGLANKKDVVINYLKNRGIGQLDHFLVSHNHADHGGAAEFVVRALKPKKTFYSGAQENMTTTFMKNWFASYAEVAMPAPIAMPVGYKIDLGDGATATAVAADCKIVHQAEVIAKLRQTQPDYVMPPCTSINDSSIVMLIKYKGFDYLVSGDMGGNVQNGQSDFETPVITSLLLASEPELHIPAKGIDVLHLGHHGSRTSSNHNYLDLSGAEVALVSVGPNQPHGLPNAESIQPLLDKKVKVLQTDEGNLTDSRMFNGGYVIGHIMVSTDGARYTVSGDPLGIDTMAQPQVVSEASKAGLPFTALVDGGGVAPVQDLATPTAVASIGGSGAAMSFSAQVGDDVGVIRADFLVDGVVVASQAPTMPVKSGVLNQAYDASRLAAGSHSAQVKVWDASGKSGLSAAAAFSVSAVIVTDKPEQEPNDSRTAATVGPAGAGTVVGYFPSTTDNIDYYAFAVAANAKLTLNMTGPTASAQDYDMFLETSSGTILASSTADGTTESIVYTNGSTARTLYLRVTRVSSYSRVTPYRIERR
jgi:beta-lactamase superfamily II metal-dependent hydrolase